MRKQVIIILVILTNSFLLSAQTFSYVSFNKTKTTANNVTNRTISRKKNIFELNYFESNDKAGIIKQTNSKQTITYNVIDFDEEEDGYYFETLDDNYETVYIMTGVNLINILRPIDTLDYYQTYEIDVSGLGFVLEDEEDEEDDNEVEPAKNASYISIYSIGHKILLTKTDDMLHKKQKRKSEDNKFKMCVDTLHQSFFMLSTDFTELIHYNDNEEIEYKITNVTKFYEESKKEIFEATYSFDFFDDFFDIEDDGMQNNNIFNTMYSFDIMNKDVKTSVLLTLNYMHGVPMIIIIRDYFGDILIVDCYYVRNIWYE